MENILVSPLPRTVEVGGAGVAINTSHRVGIQVARTAGRELPDSVKAGIILRLYFGESVFDDAVAALDAAMTFHRAGAKSEGSGRRLMDFDDDAGRILADFLRHYSIDLSDPAFRMHWWTFLALLGALPPDSALMTAMRYRNPAPKGLSSDERADWRRMAAFYALTPRTRAEEIAAIEADWE